MHIVIFIASNLEWIFKILASGLKYENRIKTDRYMQNFYPWLKFRWFMSETLLLFLDLANSRLPFEKYPFVAKMGKKMVYALV